MKDRLKPFLKLVQRVYIDHEPKRFETIFDTGDVHGGKHRRHTAEDMSLFSFVTCIVDGVPVYCRGTGSFYNGKKKKKYINFQCGCCVTGRPLFKCNGRPGRINDTKAFEACPWKGPHYTREQVMADGGYPACAHCIYPYYCERDEVEGEKRSKKERKREKKECTRKSVCAMMSIIKLCVFSEQG